MTPSHAPQLSAALAVVLLLQATTPAFGQVANASAPASEPAAGRPVRTARTTPLEGDAKLLLILDRFTYGPRPGDLERLRQIGIQAWFEQQLNPPSIDDSSLEVHLADYPAMQLSIPELMRRYPDNPMVRKVLNGNLSIPTGVAEKAIYASQTARYQAKLEGRKQPGQLATDSPGQMQTPAQARNDATPALPLPSMAGNLSGEMEVQTPTQNPTPTPAVPLPFTPAAALAMPPDQRFNAICKLSPTQQKALRDAMPPADRAQLTVGFTSLELEQFAALSSPVAVVSAEAVQTKLLRDIYSERQLNEIMTDFWLNHFNVYLRKSQFAPYYIATYARDTIRPRALGSFENLLVATAVSPAMLNYLDNASSVGPNSSFAERPRPRLNPGKRPDIGLNENYARELMELHTLGVDGGYTQHDVTEVAKVFTGWTLGDPDQPRGPNGQYRGPGGLPIQSEFDESRHQPGPKLVLGHTIKPGGEREGLEVLHMLATSPATARFLSTKLAVRFVSDEPPQAMIDRMAKTFLATNGNIRQVLLAMVNSPEFFTSATVHGKVKTPVDFVVSAVRASGAEVESAGALANVIADLGMPIYGMQTPNGYSMKADPWNNTASLVARLNFALALSTNRVMGVRTNWDGMLAAAHSTPDNSTPAEPADAPAAVRPGGHPERQSAGQPRQPVSDQEVGLSIAQLVDETTDSDPTDGAAPSRPTPTGHADAESSKATHLSPTAKEGILEARLLHGAASERTHQAILAQITTDPGQQQASLRQVAVENRSRDPLAIYRTPPPQPAPGGQSGSGDLANTNRAPRPLDVQAALAAGLLFGSPEFQRR